MTTIEPPSEVSVQINPASIVEASVLPAAPIQVLLSEPSHIEAVVVQPAQVAATLVSSQGPPGRDAGLVMLEADTAKLAYKVVTTDLNGKAVYASIDQLHANRVVGVTTNAGTNLAVKSSGDLENPGWTWLPNVRLYLGLDGEITPSPGSGQFTMQLGYAISATRIFISFGRGISRT